jgi:hypothetical protein
VDFEELFVNSPLLFPFEGMEKAPIGVQLFKRDLRTPIADTQMENDPGDNIQKDRLDWLEKNDSHVAPFIIQIFA